MKGLKYWLFVLPILNFTIQPVAVFAEERAAGHYYLDADIAFFIPCGSDNPFLLVGTDKVLQPLQRLWDKLSASSPSRPLYVEVTGHFEENPDAEGRAADFDGLYRIESVLTTHADSPANCPVLEGDD